MIYILFALLLFYFLYNYDVCGIQKNKKFWYNVILVLLILFAGLRYRCGGDTLGYIEVYKSTPDIFSFNFSTLLQGQFQPIWTIYCVFLKTISSSFVILQLVNAFLINLIIFSFLKNHSKYPFTAVFFYYLLYYLLFNFELMREGLAVAVFLFGFRYWEQKKWLRFMFVAVICFNIHVSSIVLFVLPFLRNIKIKFSTFLIILLLFGIASKILFTIFLNSIDLSYSISTGLKENVLNYAKNILMKEHYNLNYYLVVWSTSLFIPLGLLVYNHFKLNITIDYPILIYLMLLFAVLASLSSILFRFGNYFIVFYLIFLSDFFVRTLKQFRNLRLVYVFLFVLLLMMQSIYNFNKSLYGTDVKGYRKYYPYYSILNPKTDPGREGIPYVKYKVNKKIIK
jgi:hypothetical protein